MENPPQSPHEAEEDPQQASPHRQPLGFQFKAVLLFPSVLIMLILTAYKLGLNDGGGLVWAWLLACLVCAVMAVGLVTERYGKGILLGAVLFFGLLILDLLVGFAGCVWMLA